MGILEEAKSLVKTIQQLGNLELYQKMLNLYNDLLNVHEEKLRLQEENEKLKQQLLINKTLIYKDGWYWMEGNGKEDGPFCTRCWDVTQKLVRTLDLENGYAICPECKTTKPFGTARTRF